MRAMVLSTFSVLFVALLVTVVSCFEQQWVGVTGQVLCGSDPAPDTEIKLWNVNIGFDDQLGSVKSDSDGNFRISGGEGAIFEMDVHLKIYTRCNRWLPCDRIIDFKIPSEYVTRSSGVTNWYDLGTINLMTETKDENHKCL